jgi:uncharacterized membrane protein
VSFRVLGIGIGAVIFYAAASATLLGGCDDPGHANVCTSQVPLVCPASPPRYLDVAPIFDAKCGSCHVATTDGEGPWPLDTYDNVSEWAGLIRQDLLNCSMPPADSGLAMTPAERWTVLSWVLCDTPQ